MSNARNPTAGTRRARYARRLGLDDNPLRRPADRVDAWLRLATAILILTAVPVTAIIAGQTADHLFSRQAQAQQAADHLVGAVLTQNARASSIDPYAAVPDTWVTARWTAPDGTARSGQVLAPIGSFAGAAVPIWVSASGAVADPPARHADVVAEVAVTMMLTSITLTGLLLGIQAVAHHFLDRRRFRSWDAEWRSIGPLWTGHRS
jgi:hypothetical protein